MKRVVIVGGGFGGLHAADELADAPVDVTIVDRHNFNTFQPLLYQVATSGLNPADVAYPIRAFLRRQRNLDFHRGLVTGVDWESHEVLVDEGPEFGGDDRIPFDYLIVATGAVVNTFGIPGSEHAFQLYSLADAVRLRNHVLGTFEAANADPSLIYDGALTIAVIGGGPTGVEIAGALTELVRVVFRRDFRRLPIARTRIVLIDLASHLLGPFSPLSQRHALETLQARGVEVQLGRSLASMGPNRIELDDGQVVLTRTVIWSAGVKAGPIAGHLGVEVGPGGRIVVGRDLRIKGRPEAFAVGDVAHVVAPSRAAWRLPWQRRRERPAAPLPQVAQVAMQSGRHAARQIVRDLEGEPGLPFGYRDKGIMATIGRHAAVTELPFGLTLKGTPAWVAWLGLHLVYLVGLRNRASVLLNWAWNYVTYDRGARLIFDASEPPLTEIGEGDRSPP
jgi:NADH:ubiquinone reductase (H+-translocating)